MAHTSGKKKRRLHRDQYRHVVLRICSKNLEPAKVTKALGIEPTWARRRGTWTAPTGAVRKFPTGSWALASRLRRNCTLENHIRDIWDQISKGKVSLKRILRKADGFLLISVRPHRDVANWNYTFSADILKESVDLGIHVWFSFIAPHPWERMSKPGETEGGAD